MKKIHLMAICGMAMGSLAGMLKAKGYEVRGSDEQVYPPMSDQLAQLGIPYFEGFKASNLDWNPDHVVVGNVITRINPEAEALRERGIPYSSLPQILAELFIRNRHSVVVTGTHGKTTTSGVLAWTLTHARRDPGFLVGGVLNNFHSTYSVAEGEHFVIEGDEYDTAYFDKVPKFVHYRPTTGIITSIEYDHADIYDNLDRIKQEFGKFVKLIPNHGLLVACVDDPNVCEVIASAASPLQTYGYSPQAEWTIDGISKQGAETQFTVLRQGRPFGVLHTSLIGRHNLLNLLGATVVLNHLGLTPQEIDAGFSTFQGVKRRQEVRGIVNDIVVIDDFAHHPTAAKVTLEAVKEHYHGKKVWSVFEPRTAATRRDVFQQNFVDAFLDADIVIFADVHRPDKAPEGHRLSTDQLVQDLRQHNVEAFHISGVENIVNYLAERLAPGDVVLIMSNGGFGDIHEKLLTALKHRIVPER
ncbi:probable UDP-N-acetylmuramate:L-alanyl-gamma-D-glutamyl-meso-diamino pimelate ligase [Candidatus Vecturithrix granuli]|uniref:Probable UDP-N-acetylmuramate:L-alanyl-gamma-D-glutamyl-meso-diamino pimelate ligase n=1 Tax=Vecturithrix granuli TaxID=1499967 RepID=A0A081C5B2_VECG1|nr:probable UDP-N-acetylmuramate:L-alanyl-gamma-D-glutamyl-meso-diamino pimelate ligase [Candidatus Vecturithrix granuli]